VRGKENKFVVVIIWITKNYHEGRLHVRRAEKDAKRDWSRDGTRGLSDLTVPRSSLEVIFRKKPFSGITSLLAEPRRPSPFRSRSSSTCSLRILLAVVNPSSGGAAHAINKSWQAVKRKIAPFSRPLSRDASNGTLINANVEQMEN